MKKRNLVFLAILYCSCNTSIKNLTNLYDKQLSGTFADFAAPSKLIFYQNSTFEYKNFHSPILSYTKGFWRLNPDKKSLVLKSIYIPNQNIGKFPIDTLYLKFDSVIVKIKSKTTVEMKKELFSIQQ
jgi:archaellum component FlaF (FlaF/FlaG flagellin family)